MNIHQATEAYAAWLDTLNNKERIMYKLILSLLLLLTSQPLAGAEWKLVWSDEFDKPGLPDPAKWGYEEGFVRNNEHQFYTRDRRENARVEDGMLVIEARKEHFKIPQGDSLGKGKHSKGLEFDSQHRNRRCLGRPKGHRRQYLPAADVHRLRAGLSRAESCSVATASEVKSAIGELHYGYHLPRMRIGVPNGGDAS